MKHEVHSLPALSFKKHQNFQEQNAKIPVERSRWNMTESLESLQWHPVLLACTSSSRLAKPLAPVSGIFQANCSHFRVQWIKLVNSRMQPSYSHPHPYHCQALMPTSMCYECLQRQCIDVLPFHWYSASVMSKYRVVSMIGTSPGTTCYKCSCYEWAQVQESMWPFPLEWLHNTWNLALIEMLCKRTLIYFLISIVAVIYVIHYQDLCLERHAAAYGSLLTR